MIRDVTITPAQGGQLSSGLSSNAAGIANYVVKRNWRRSLDREIRSEGAEYFWPATSKPIANQPFPNPDKDEPITLIGMLRRPNGETAVIACTPTRIYRYFTLASGKYVNPTNPFFYFAQSGPGTPVIELEGAGTPFTNDETQPSDYFSTNPADYPVGQAAEYISENPGDWLLIGSGYSSTANRWEIAFVNGSAVLNNGVDLPVEYRVEWFSVKPLYELREAGIARVGTIASFYGVLLLGDVHVIPSSLMADWMNGSTPYGAYTGQVDRFAWRIIWSDEDAPSRFKATVPCAAVKGSREVVMRYPASSITPGATVTVLGAGANGGNLTAGVLGVDGTTLTIDVPAEWDNSDTTVQLADAAEQIVGYYDIQGDGSAILRMKELGNYLVVYKESQIFLGSFLGQASAPFAFVKRYPDDSSQTESARCLVFKYTLVSVADQFHIYAGANSFYRFDLTTQVPTEVQLAERCKNLFFNSARKADINLVFAADNTVTREVWFSFPSQYQDKILRYDYTYGTISTSDFEITAACMVQRPRTQLSNEPVQNWFVMGTTHGAVLRYGLIDAAPVMPQGGTAKLFKGTIKSTVGIFTPDHVGQTVVFANGHAAPISEYVGPMEVKSYDTTSFIPHQDFKVVWHCLHWLGAGYDSVMQSGAGDFGSSVNDKQLAGYMVVPASDSTRATIKVEILTSRTPADAQRIAGSRIVDDPLAKPFIPAGIRAPFIADRITASGFEQFGISARVFSLIPTRTRGAASYGV